MNGTPRIKPDAPSKACGVCGKIFWKHVRWALAQWPDIKYCSADCRKIGKSRPRTTLAQRFWSKVYMEPNSGCWLWTGAISSGYGTVLDGKTRYAHIVSYELENGPVPNGLMLDHLCRVPCCVNPRHLEPVTPRINVMRGFSPAAIAARTATCKRGHELTGRNVFVNTNGKQQCRVCTNSRVLKRRRRIRAELSMEQIREQMHG